jgi:hypothetical protein
VERVPVKQLERPVERRPVGGGITARDFIERPELIMVVAAILMIIGAFGPWASWGTYGGDISGWDLDSGKVTFFIGLIMLYSAVVSLGYVDFFKEVFPVLSVSAVCGVVALVLALVALDSGGWGLYLTIIASLIALFAAFRAYTLSGARIGRRAL